MIHETAYPVQELYNRRLILALPAMPGEQQWGVHASVRAAVQNLALPDQKAVDQLQRTAASARIRFALCMAAELAGCAMVPLAKAARIALAQQANFYAALEAAGTDVSIRTAVSQELLRKWPAFEEVGWVGSVGRVAGLLLPSLEQLCNAAALASAARGESLDDQEDEGMIGAQGTEFSEQDKKGWKEWVSKSAQLDVVDGEVPKSVLWLKESKEPFAELLLLQAEFASVQAFILNRSQENNAEAAEKHRTAYEMRRQVLDKKHQLTLSSMGGMALCTGKHSSQVGESKKGKGTGPISEREAELKKKREREEKKRLLAEAAKMHEDVWKLRCEVLGAEHPDTLESINDLAWCMMGLQQFDEAITWYKQVIDLRCRILDPEDKSTLLSMQLLAQCMLNKSKMLGNEGGELLDEAEVMFEKVRKLRVKVLDSKHAGTLTTMSNIAECKRIRGHFVEAAEMHEEVWKARCEVLGGEHEKTRMSVNSIGTLAKDLRKSGKETEALEMEQRVKRMEQETAGSLP